MQTFIAKYGLAAHLAFMAVAPLFLFPFFEENAVAGALIWLTSLSACWMLLSPSVYGGEMVHDSRKRVVVSLSRDPLFWVLLTVVIGAFIMQFNDGIQLAYDAENRSWSIAAQAFPLLPGSVSGCGKMPFAAAYAATVAVLACRHSLGRAARQAFLFIAASMSGLAALMAIFMINQGNELPAQIAACGETMKSFVGMAFGVHLLGGVVALVAAFERSWNRAMPAFLLALGGNAAGLFTFSPGVMSIAFSIAAALLFAYGFLYARFVLRRQAEFKCFVLLLFAVALGGAAVYVVLPSAFVAERLEECLDPQTAALALVDEGRAVLSAAAFKIWKGHLWIGSGLGAFPLELRFAAQPEDWKVIPHGLKMVSNGWWQVLSEQGVLGVLALVLPFAFLAFTYFKRLFGGIVAREWPRPAFLAGPLALAVVVAASFFDCSFLRADVLSILGALLVISASAFPSLKKR